MWTSSDKHLSSLLHPLRIRRSLSGPVLMEAQWKRRPARGSDGSGVLGTDSTYSTLTANGSLTNADAGFDGRVAGALQQFWKRVSVNSSSGTTTRGRLIRRLCQFLE